MYQYFQLHLSRILLFVAAMVPSAVWLLSDAKLAHPFTTLLWTFVCAIAFAIAPGQLGAVFSAWLQILLTPLTIIWIGTVATTGTGPSGSLIEAALTSGRREIAASIHTALKQPSGIIVGMLTITVCITLARVAPKTPIKSSNAASILFVMTFLAISVIVIDRKHVARFAPYEARSAIPLISHLVMMQESLRILNSGFVQSMKEWRPAASAKLFEARNGLAVFVVGESMRADALIKDGRGPWSKLLRDRLEQGLGARAADACAYGNLTLISVPRLLTAAAIDDTSDIGGRPTILAMTKAAGAKTAYIFNQGAVVKESGHDFIAHGTSSDFIAYDDLAVELFADFTAKSGTGPKAAILHLMGQHYSYDDRYPSGIFGPEPAGLSESAYAELRYDRAAEYGVKILLDLARILDAQSEPAYLIFTSDHGENFLSDGAGKTLHGGMPGRYDTTVPVLFLWNRAFASSGRVKEIAPLLKYKGLIAHRDVALTWLTLAGSQQKVSITKNPQTLIPTSSGGKAATIACSELPP
jgi:glucan phosphoethanolaminetransferase (alkaline phosphatase superfamily)